MCSKRLCFLVSRFTRLQSHSSGSSQTGRSRLPTSPLQVWVVQSKKLCCLGVKLPPYSTKQRGRVPPPPIPQSSSCSDDSRQDQTPQRAEHFPESQAVQKSSEVRSSFVSVSVDFICGSSSSWGGEASRQEGTERRWAGGRMEDEAAPWRWRKRMRRRRRWSGGTFPSPPCPLPSTPSDRRPQTDTLQRITGSGF